MIVDMALWTGIMVSTALLQCWAGLDERVMLRPLTRSVAY
jgi:hypothetical protein